jgi:hypothetical protein
MVSAKLHDKLRKGAQPFLEPGEQIELVFPSQTGPHPFLIWAVPGAIFWAKHNTVVVTDRNIVVLKNSFWRGALHPKMVRARLPRQPLGTLQGGLFCGKVIIGGKRHWVANAFVKEVAAANADLDSLAPNQPSAPRAAAWCPDPTKRHQLRYWDGKDWTAYVADQGTQSSDPIAA